MAYDNLTNIPTSKSGSWDTGTSEFYYGDIISLESGIPHKDQLEVERIFSLPTSPVDVANNITVFDLHRIFIVNKNDYSVNETTSKITSLTPSNPTTRYYTLTGGGPGITGTVVTIPTIVNGEAIVVRRKTFSSGKYVTWSAGTRLTSEQLNLQMNQLIKINQELIYKLESEYLRSSDISGTSAPSFTVDNDLDMNSNKITELGNPSDATDAVNKQYADAQYVKVGDSVAQSITGAKTFSGAAVFQNTVTMDSSLLVTGMTTLNGGLTMDTNKFLVANDTGNTTVGGTLNVTGATVLSSTLNAGASTLASASVTGALSAGSMAVDTTTLVVDASNDRVGIGTVAPDCNLHVRTTGTPEIRVETPTTTQASLVASKANVATVDIRTYGSGTSGGALIAGQTRPNLTALYATSSSSLVIVTNTAAPIVFGTNNTERLSIPADASGIKFPASGLSTDPNTLDSYVEVTHTIAAGDFRGATTAGTHTLGENTIRYTRIGNRVFFDLNLSTTACTVDGAGQAKIINLPFTSASDCYFTIDYWNGMISTLMSFTGVWSGTEILFYGNGAAVNAISDLPITSFRTTGTTPDQTFTIRASGCIRV
jgi:hypothetical protein